MKKLIAISLSLVAVLVLAACGGKSVKVTDFGLTPPEGFQEMEQNGMLIYMAPGYPADSANINIYVTDETTDISKLDKAAFETQIQGQVKAQAEAAGISDASIAVESFEHTEVAGFSAIRTEYTTTMMGVAMQQLQYIVVVDKTYNFTFTDLDGGSWMEAFEKAAQTIYFETE